MIGASLFVGVCGAFRRVGSSSVSPLSVRDGMGSVMMVGEVGRVLKRACAACAFLLASLMQILLINHRGASGSPEKLRGTSGSPDT